MQMPTRINLLPYRERRVKELRVHFFSITGVVMTLGIMVILGVDFFLNTFVANQENRVDQLKNKVQIQDQEIADIANLKKDIELLIGRKSVIESLQDDKNNPIRFFNALSKSLPGQGIYLTGLTQSGINITLAGIADGNARISSFIANLENSDGVFKNVRLGASGQFEFGTQKFFNFTLQFDCPLYAKK